LKGLIVMFGTIAALNAAVTMTTVLTAMNNSHSSLMFDDDNDDRPESKTQNAEPETKDHLVSTTPSPCINSKNTVAEINEALNKAIS